MYKLSISFGPGVWALMFKTKEKAEETWHTWQLMVGTANSVFGAEDDFGQRIVMKANNITGMMLEDLEQSKIAHIEDTLHRGRTQADIQHRAKADPKLQMASMMGNSGPMLSPMGRG